MAGGKKINKPKKRRGKSSKKRRSGRKARKKRIKKESKPAKRGRGKNRKKRKKSKKGSSKSPSPFTPLSGIKGLSSSSYTSSSSSPSLSSLSSSSSGTVILSNPYFIRKNPLHKYPWAIGKPKKRRSHRLIRKARSKGVSFNDPISETQTIPKDQVHTFPCNEYGKALQRKFEKILRAQNNTSSKKAGPRAKLQFSTVIYGLHLSLKWIIKELLGKFKSSVRLEDFKRGNTADHPWWLLNVCLATVETNQRMTVYRVDKERMKMMYTACKNRFKEEYPNMDRQLLSIKFSHFFCAFGLMLSKKLFDKCARNGGIVGNPKIKEMEMYFWDSFFKCLSE